MASLTASSNWFGTANATIKANFCPECGGLLPLPSMTGQIVCTVCQYSCTTQDLATRIVVTRSQEKDVKRVAKAHGDTAAVVRDGSVTCPRCNHHELSFKTAQLRSADEGQTIFYECVKCKFTWSVNT